MTYADFASFVFVASLLVISPGPNGVLIAKTVPTSGHRAGFANIAGFVLAFYLHGLLSIFGISLILMQSALAFQVIKLLGAGYLCYIGARALFSAWKGDVASEAVAPAKRKRSLSSAFAEGFLTNGLNPKVSMFYLAAFPQFLPVSTSGEAAVMGGLAMVSAHAAINALWFGAMVILFAQLAGAARNPRIQRWIKGVTGVVFLGFGAKLATLRTVSP